MTPADRMKAAILGVIRELLPNLAFLPPTTYRVDKAEGGKFTARPETKGRGFPDIVDAPISGSVTGGHSATKLAKGTRVLVIFPDGDRARPTLIAIYDPNEPEQVAIEGSVSVSIVAPAISFNGGVQPVARVGDLVAGIFPITSGNPLVKA